MITAVRRHSGKCALAGAAPVGARAALRTGASVLAWSHLNASLCEVPSGSSLCLSLGTHRDGLCPNPEPWSPTLGKLENRPPAKRGDLAGPCPEL